MFSTDYTDKTEMIITETMVTISFLCTCFGIGAFVAGLWYGNTDAYVAAAVAWAYPSVLQATGAIIALYENRNS